MYISGEDSKIKNFTNWKYYCKVFSSGIYNFLTQIRRTSFFINPNKIFYWTVVSSLNIIRKITCRQFSPSPVRSYAIATNSFYRTRIRTITPFQIRWFFTFHNLLFFSKIILFYNWISKYYKQIKWYFGYLKYNKNNRNLE